MGIELNQTRVADICQTRPIKSRNEKNSAFFCAKNPEMPMFTGFLENTNGSHRERKTKK